MPPRFKYALRRKAPSESGYSFAADRGARKNWITVRNAECHLHHERMKNTDVPMFQTLTS